MLNGKPIIAGQNFNLQNHRFDKGVHMFDNMNLNQICFVMELLEQDVNLMLKNNTKNFTEGHMIKIVYHTLCALAFVHEANVIHRDIKPANILISPNCNVKICDFGLSRTIAPSSSGFKGYNSISVREAYYENTKNEIVSKYDETQYIAHILTKSRFQRSEKKRAVSVYVGTRWYRAPEISLVERHYDQA